MPDHNKFKHRSYSDAKFRSEAIDNNSLPDIVGHAIVCNVIGDGGSFTEEILREAVTKCLSANPLVRALWNHETKYVLAGTPDSLKLEQDDVGLLSRISPIDTSYARDLIKLIEADLVNKMSFGFFIVDEEAVIVNGKLPHFKIKEIDLFDVSPVTFPFYKQTDLSIDRAASAKTKLQESLRRHTSTEDEAVNLVEAAIEQELRSRKLILFESEHL